MTYAVWMKYDGAQVYRGRRYLRFTFKRDRNHGAQISMDVLGAHMVMVAALAEALEIPRVMVIVNAPRRDQYGINELSEHAKVAHRHFNAIRLAYVNTGGNIHRIGYITSVMRHLGSGSTRAFTDARQALDWLTQE